MGILFENGPRNQIATRKEKQMILDALSHCWHPDSFYYRLNMLFNNVEHFSNPMFDLHTQSFLQDVAMLATSPQDHIVVKGGIHQDPGHSSRVIYQVGDYHGDYRNPCWVQDTYIAFSIQLQDKNKSDLRVLRPNHTYHFLMERPFILKCPVQNEHILIQMIDPYVILQDPVVYQALAPHHTNDIAAPIQFVPPVHAGGNIKSTHKKRKSEKSETGLKKKAHHHHSNHVSFSQDAPRRRASHQAASR